jgi:hypothetical protein
LKTTPDHPPPLTSDLALLDVDRGMRDMVAEARAEWVDHLESCDED